MASDNKAVFLGLNQTGVIVFILGLIFCFPVAIVPFLVPSMKGDPE